MIILCGHGHYGETMKNSLEMIAGQQEQIQTIEFNMEMAVTDIITKYNEMIAARKNIQEEVLIFCDIPGGSPANAAILAKNYNKNVRAFTGLNLPLILSLVMGEDVECCLNNAKEAIKEI